jgi:putative chitinase
MIIEKAQLAKLLPGNTQLDVWLPLLNLWLPTAGIIMPSQVARFISQCAHEAMNFTVLVENLNYGVPGLLGTFSKYFNASNVGLYARKPMKIANRVYANRMGNGTEESGDGWKFRGRGILQITGKVNYEACSKYIFGDDTLLSAPERLLEPEYALKSALWYWTKNNLNDIEDMQVLTKRINGGTNGLADRLARYADATKVFA